MKQYIVDAFSQEIFRGNPAAVCVLEDWLPVETMSSIALENNLSETAFTVPEGDGYRLRWFTPGGEIDLCGHATLATAYVLLRFYETSAEEIHFQSMSGPLVVRKRGELLELDFPAFALRPIPVTDAMTQAFGKRPLEAYLGRDLLCIFETPGDIREMAPDQGKLQALPGLLQHASAQGEDTDCISRSFAPKLSVAEDPVCGSGHCHIIPYWAGKLGKSELVAYQASRRGGTLYCRSVGEKVYLAGYAALFAESVLRL